MRPSGLWWHAALLASAVVAGACTSSSSPDEGSPTSGDGPAPPSTVEIDLAGEHEDPEIATLLEFTTGAGGIGYCDSFDLDDDYFQMVADGVGVTLGLREDDGFPIGKPLSLCVSGVEQAVSGTITPPGGDPIEIPGPGLAERAGTVEVVQDEPFHGVGTVVLTTFPGAPIGNYEVDLTDGAPPASFALDLQPAIDLGAGPHYYQYAKYDDVYPTGTLDLNHGDDVEFGFVGQEPEGSGAYFLYRVIQDDPCCLPWATYTLVDRLEVAYDERGEAALRMPTDTSPPNACFVLVERQEALSEVAAQGRIAISGGEPSAFCLGSASTGAIVVDACGQLDGILSSFQLPAGGHTFCASTWGAILSYHASNYGFTAYTKSGGSWEETAAMNLGETPVVELLTSVGFPSDLADAMCRAVEPYAEGPDLGC